MTVTVEIKGAREVLANLDLANQNIRAAVGAAVQREGIRVQGLAREFAPVDTGALRASIQYAPTGEMEAVVQDGVAYGVFQEFGTSRAPAQPFMRPAVEVSIPEYLAELKAAVEAASLPKR